MSVPGQDQQQVQGRVAPTSPQPQNNLLSEWERERASPSQTDAMLSANTAERAMGGTALGAHPNSHNNRHRMKEIHITPLDRGFIVTVGCQSMAISNSHELISKLNAYIMQPEQTTVLYEKGEL
jgi:hypothetical protein